MKLHHTPVLAAILLAAIGFEAWRVLTPAPAVRDAPRFVEIPARVSGVQVAWRLTQAEVIRSPESFVAVSLVRGSLRSLKAGEYAVPRGASTLDVLALLESGRVHQHPVLHPEGATVAELAQLLDNERLAAAADIVRVAHDPAFLRAHDIAADSVEGYLFPDTYYFVRGLTPPQMLDRMVQRMFAKLTPDIRARARTRGLGVHELLTLASIIEREAVVPDERRLISAVFWNRLKLGMPLQADPTVQYGAGKERRALTRLDLRTDQPYNTYQRPGLPPGPIASPGLAAVEAALDPAAVSYLYFVAKDDHRHHFSTTLDEHQRAVTRYRTARSR